MATVEVLGSACTACGVCVEICPTDVLCLEMEGGPARAVYPEDCQACFLCEIDCPFEAIRVFPR